MRSASTLPTMVLLALVGMVHASELLLDPTRPDGWRATAQEPETLGGAQSPSLRLQGVFNRGGVRTAVVSGQHVSVGDRVAGGEVVRIDNDKVTLVVNGRLVELAVRVNIVKSPNERDEGLR